MVTMHQTEQLHINANATITIKWCDVRLECSLGTTVQLTGKLGRICCCLPDGIDKLKSVTISSKHRLCCNHTAKRKCTNGPNLDRIHSKRKHNNNRYGRSNTDRNVYNVCCMLWDDARSGRLLRASLGKLSL